MRGEYFLILLFGYLTIATAILVIRATRSIGFIMYVLVYPLVLTAYFFVPVMAVVGTWFMFVILTVVALVLDARRHVAARLNPAVFVSSIFIWPVQLAALVTSLRFDLETQYKRNQARAVLGELPATVTGTISFTHHIDQGDGVDMLWLQEYGELEIFIDAALFDQYELGEGKSVTLTVDETDGTRIGSQEKILWVKQVTV